MGRGRAGESLHVPPLPHPGLQGRCLAVDPPALQVVGPQFPWTWSHSSPCWASCAAEPCRLAGDGGPPPVLPGQDRPAFGPHRLPGWPPAPGVLAQSPLPHRPEAPGS